MTLIVNLFGGPGSGKSTTAAGTFFFLKNSGVNCEYVTEFAKDMVWQDNQAALQCQPYVFGNQYYKLWSLLGKVDIVVTDSPILLNLEYSKNNKELDALVVKSHRSLNNLNIFLGRKKAYNPLGRNQTEFEAIQIDKSLKGMLQKLNEPFIEIEADGLAPLKIIQEIYNVTGK